MLIELLFVSVMIFILVMMELLGYKLIEVQYLIVGMTTQPLQVVVS